MPFYLSRTGMATAFLTSLRLSFVKSFSSVIRWCVISFSFVSASLTILPLVKALPARPRLLFILIDIAVNWPATYLVSPERERL